MKEEKRLGWDRSGKQAYIADYGRQRIFVKKQTKYWSAQFEEGKSLPVEEPAPDPEVEDLPFN